MQIVIDIDDEVYSHAKDYEHRLITPNESNILRDSIANGTPLPKGHGDLKDVDAIHDEIGRLQSGIAQNGGAVNISRDQYKGMCYARGIINEAPVIIEADKEGGYGSCIKMP